MVLDLMETYKLNTGVAVPVAEILLPLSAEVEIRHDLERLGDMKPLAHVYQGRLSMTSLPALVAGSIHTLIYLAKEEAHTALRVARELCTENPSGQTVTVRFMYIGPVTRAMYRVNDSTRGHTWNNLWEGFQTAGYIVLQTVCNGEVVTLCDQIPVNAEVELYLYNPELAA